jgi:ubiquitin-protein ligase
MSDKVIKRLQKELANIRKQPMDGVEITVPDESNLLRWECTFKGASGSCYAGETHKLIFTFEPTYPFDAPEVVFASKIVHPHV